MKTAALRTLRLEQSRLHSHLTLVEKEYTPTLTQGESHLVLDRVERARSSYLAKKNEADALEAKLAKPSLLKRLIRH